MFTIGRPAKADGSMKNYADSGPCIFCQRPSTVYLSAMVASKSSRIALCQSCYCNRGFLAQTLEGLKGQKFSSRR